jgi:hypothetical protein
MSAMPDTPTAVKTRLREAVAQAAAQGLDRTVEEIESALVSAWLLERRGALEPRDVPDFVAAVESALRRIAPPPPRKVKFSEPLRKILPLSEAAVRPAFDAALLLLALAQVGDFTEEPDKRRREHELFLDDWRRMIWESARISDWARFRRLVGREERVLEGRLSRDVALQTLEAIARRRADNLTPLPDLSVVACARCGQNRGRDRIRCARCRGTFCTRCLGPSPDLCLPDYAARYATIDPERRRRLADEARALLKELRLDAHARNDAFARALKEKGVDVIFSETAPLEGEESPGVHGRFKFVLRDREGPSAKRALFGALARAHARGAGVDAAPAEVDYFTDVCLGLPVEEALGASPAPPPPPPAPEGAGPPLSAPS